MPETLTSDATITDTMVAIGTDTLSATAIAPSTIRFMSDTRAFRRIYRASRSAWNGGENPLSSYFDTESESFGRRFGLEIEFDTDGSWIAEGSDGDCYCECQCDTWCGGDCIADFCECFDTSATPVSDFLADNGYLPFSALSGYHDGAGMYDSWRYEADCTVTGGEVISPIMDANGASWETIRKVMQGITDNGGHDNTVRAGGHVNIDIPDFNFNLHGRRLALMVRKFEDVMYRLATNPQRSRRAGGARRHRGVGYAGALASQIRGLNRRQRQHYFNRGYWLAVTPYANRAEFRIFDATLDPALSQTFALIASKFMDVVVKDDDSINPMLESLKDRPLGWHVEKRTEHGAQARESLSGQAWKDDTRAIRKFVDLLFDNDQDKERIITLFAGTDWNRG